MIISFKDDEERLFHHILAILSDKNQIMHVSVDTLQTLSFPGLTIQPLQHRVIQNEKEVELTHLEFGVLLFLARRDNLVVAMVSTSPLRTARSIANRPGLQKESA